MAEVGDTESFGQRWFGWAYDGVDPTLAGNGGPECVAVIPMTQKIVETLVLTLVAIVQIKSVWPKLHITSATPADDRGGKDDTGRRILLMVMCLTFGTEIGFKLASRQMIWILNQCHVVTMIQVMLYASVLIVLAQCFTLFALSLHASVLLL